MQKVDYAGCLIVVQGKLLILQNRDNIKGISNPDMVTTFGGKVENGEGHKKALERELREELELEVPDEALCFLAYIERFDVEKQYVVGCWFYLLELDCFENGICHEGAIFRVGIDQIESVEKLGPICLELVTRYKRLKASGVLYV